MKYARKNFASKVEDEDSTAFSQIDIHECVTDTFRLTQLLCEHHHIGQVNPTFDGFLTLRDQHHSKKQMEVSSFQRSCTHCFGLSLGSPSLVFWNGL
jgi:hypothetical protein